ncbi:MAG: exopolysaccharide biosynthesis polyprenyl glycosylphosphotransferase, partial [Terriglobales bacterium]
LHTGPWRVAEWFEKEAVAGPRSDDTLDRLRQLVRSGPIDEILIADSLWEAGPEARAFFRGVGDLCEQTGVRLHVYAQWLSGCRRVDMDYLGDCPIMTFSFSVASPWLLAIKRAADLGASALLLVVLSPLLAATAAAVMLDSPGPALFSQVRCGLRGRAFRIYKFRSMVADAEERKAALAAANEMSGPVFKLAGDPRITRVGRWLRKTSLDELPQLWNVLRGEMSLVGPRPPLPAEVKEYHLESLHRLAMKPGMTGLWQVSGRSAIRDFGDWVELDARYIRRWSLWLDGKILFRTIGVLARMNGQ